MLFDASGQAIYLFDDETSTEPTCYDECAEAWPPVLTPGIRIAKVAAERGPVWNWRGSWARVSGAMPSSCDALS